MICADCQRAKRSPEPGAMTSQTPGASPALRCYCDACGYALARQWVPDVRPGPRASDTAVDRGHFEILPYRDGASSPGGVAADLLATVSKVSP